VPRPCTDFDSYFDQRARRFARFYRNEPISRMLGRGPILDRLRLTVDQIIGLRARHVLDVGCGSGVLIPPLAERGIRVTGLDPAPAMLQLAVKIAARYPGLAEVQQGRWEDLREEDAHDVAVALGVFDYVDQPAVLLAHLGRAAPRVIASFPGPGLRLELRKVRYGAHGVQVRPYPFTDFGHLAAAAGLQVAEVVPLGRAGHLVQFRRETRQPP